MPRAHTAVLRDRPSRLSRAALLALALAPALAPAPTIALAQVASSTLQNPEVSFLTTGIKTVTLEVCNANGCAQVTQAVTVLDPSPVIATAAVSPPVSESGQLVRLSGSGLGKPPLVFTWSVWREGSLVATLPGATVFWDTSGQPAGLYSAVLRLENGVGSVETAPLALTLTPETSLGFCTINPCRVFDSRGTGLRLTSGVARAIQVAGVCDLPAGALAVAANVTVVSPTGQGHISLYPGNYPLPVTSAINFASGAVRSNNAILELATDGTGTLAATPVVAGGGSVDVILDVSGYFLPIP